ncbi:MAG: sensor histidine kinase, partial [Methyloligellaceae bacterium]
FERTKGEIIHLDEVLTMSARMAAATGDLRWEERYRRAEPKLDDAIRTALDLSGRSIAPVTATQQANDRLVEIENRAFDLIRSGQAAAASAILQNDLYEAQKRIYAQGMQNFIDQVQGHLSTALQAQRTRVILSLIAAGLSIAFVVGVWIYVLSRVRTWHSLIASAYELRRQAAEDLAEHRDHLQELVDKATVKLSTKAEKLKRALAKEKELNELQRQFVSMASHEFRTPLAIIDATAQRLRRRADQLTPEEAIKRVDKIRNAVERMTRLMESTLTAARMEDGKVAVEIGPCHIRKVVLEVCERLQEISANHAISCELADLPDTIQADAGALEQVLANLVSNAVKYAPEAPDIGIKAFREGHDVVISVRDHGLGIDEADLPHMFERFFRAKNSTGIAGTGIGLNLVKALVEMHGGSIGVESDVGEGSLFTVRLPIAGPGEKGQADTRAA